MSLVPPEVRGAVERALEAADGRPLRITGGEAIAGGCINPAASVETDRGESYFLKWNASAPAGMFEAEADGLRALREAARGSGVRVPAVRALGEAAGGTSWLLLELVPRGSPGRDWGTALGRGLAALHGAAGDARPAWGWERDNFIGSLPQANDPTPDWPSFWRSRRLAPQLERARAEGRLSGRERRVLDDLLDRVPAALGDAAADGPSLLHGDLWSGNVYPGPAGEPVLVDPAVYRGHREVDLAMSELFGGFPRGWLDAYREARPVSPAYARLRRPLYQLYYLLVHVNLFGRSYVAASLEAAREVLAHL